MVPCKTGDLDPVTTLVAPLVFAVGSEVDVSGNLGLESEGSLVFCVQDFLGESWPLYLLLWAPGSPCHLKCHVMGHKGVFHPCEAKTKSLRRVLTVPCSPRTSQCLLSLLSLPAPWVLSTSPVQEQLLLCSSTCHHSTPCVDLWLDTCPNQAPPLCSRCYDRQKGTRDEPHPRAEEQVCFPCNHRLIKPEHKLCYCSSCTVEAPGAVQVLHTFAHHRQEQCCAVLRPCHKEETWGQGLEQQDLHESKLS